MHRWTAKYPNIPYDLVRVGSYDIPPKMIMSYTSSRDLAKTKPYPFSFDLRAAVKRQIVFARKITAMYPSDPVPEHWLLMAQQRYVKYMNLVRMNSTAGLVPAMDIDLFWHTHQLSAMTYLAWCTKHIGRAINHDDTGGPDEHSNGLDATVIIAWQSAYSEDYLHPTPSQNAGVPVNWPPREPTTADKTPPPGLTPAQHRLWMEDVHAQREMEKHSFHLHQFREKLQSTERRIEGLRNLPLLQAAAPCQEWR